MEKLNERDLFKIFSFWQERVSVRATEMVAAMMLAWHGMHSFTKFLALSIVHFCTIFLFHLSAAAAAAAVAYSHYYYQFNTYNTLIPAAVAVTERATEQQSNSNQNQIQVLTPATAATKNKQ